MRTDLEGVNYELLARVDRRWAVVEQHEHEYHENHSLHDENIVKCVCATANFWKRLVHEDSVP